MTFPFASRAALGFTLLAAASLAGACSSTTTSGSMTSTAAGGAGGGTATCTVTGTILVLPEGSSCGLPRGACEPASACDAYDGFYCAGSKCDRSVAGSCTKAPADCGADLGPAVRGCDGACYASACLAAKAGTVGDVDATCTGAGGAGGAGGGTTTCTVTDTILELTEGAGCGLPPGPCDPVSECSAFLGLYCAGSTCDRKVGGVCTKAPEDCSAAPGPAVRGCNGLCYASPCLAAKAGVVGDEDAACAGAGGAGGGG